MVDFLQHFFVFFSDDCKILLYRADRNLAFVGDFMVSKLEPLQATDLDAEKIFEILHGIETR
ncbi:MAG: hypothetical protein PXY39_05925 [archaeon]|nr:hypothetical protein [archaeon]